GDHDFVGGGDAEKHFTIGDHLHDRRARSAFRDIDIEPAFFEILRKFRGVKTAELRLGFPIERKLQVDRLGLRRRRRERQRQRCEKKQDNAHEDFLSEVCHELNERDETRLTAPTSTMPSNEEISTAAKTRSILCWVRAESTTLPKPPPPINSPTIVPTTARPEAILKP